MTRHEPAPQPVASVPEFSSVPADVLNEAADTIDRLTRALDEEHALRLAVCETRNEWEMLIINAYPPAVEIANGYANFLDAVLAERDRLTRELAAQAAELETERMRLAACMTAALGNTPTTRADAIKPGHPYYSGSYGCVLDTVDREMALRDERDTLRRALERIRQWDHLDTAGDGPYWKREIDTVLRREPEAARTEPT